MFQLRQLKNNTENLGYRDVNLLSFMKLTSEKLHKTVNKKHGTQTILTYRQSFASSMMAFVKQFVEWAPYYFISGETWIPFPENTTKLEELKFPKWKKVLPILSLEEKREMREWVSSNDAVVQ